MKQSYQKIFVTFLVLTPHSNSFCEIIFSTVKEILTETRKNLGNDVVECIRNNVLAFLIAKLNIFKQQEVVCYQWNSQ